MIILSKKEREQLGDLLHQVSRAGCNLEELSIGIDKLPKVTSEELRALQSAVMKIRDQHSEFGHVLYQAEKILGVTPDF